MARFAVGLSFPGVVRPQARALADVLAGTLGKTRILFDEYVREETARPDADIYLANLYAKEAELVVVILHPEYAESEWCLAEWRFIRNYAKDRLMFLSVGGAGDLSALGILPLDGYADIQGESPDEVAQRVLRRHASLAGSQLERASAIRPRLHWLSRLACWLRWLRGAPRRAEQMLSPPPQSALSQLGGIAPEPTHVGEVVSAKRHLLVWGLPGVGKSHLTRVAGERLAASGVCSFYVDFRDASQNLFAALAGGTSQASLQEVLYVLSHRPCCIFLEDIHLEAGQAEWCARLKAITDLLEEVCRPNPARRIVATLRWTGDPPEAPRGFGLLHQQAHTQESAAALFAKITGDEASAEGIRPLFKQREMRTEMLIRVAAWVYREQQPPLHELASFRDVDLLAMYVERLCNSADVAEAYAAFAHERWPAQRFSKGEIWLFLSSRSDLFIGRRDGVVFPHPQIVEFLVARHCARKLVIPWRGSRAAIVEVLRLVAALASDRDRTALFLKASAISVAAAHEMCRALEYSMEAMDADGRARLVFNSMSLAVADGSPQNEPRDIDWAIRSLVASTSWGAFCTLVRALSDDESLRNVISNLVQTGAAQRHAADLLFSLVDPKVLAEAVRLERYDDAAVLKRQSEAVASSAAAAILIGDYIDDLPVAFALAACRRYSKFNPKNCRVESWRNHWNANEGGLGEIVAIAHRLPQTHRKVLGVSRLAEGQFHLFPGVYILGDGHAPVRIARHVEVATTLTRLGSGEIKTNDELAAEVSKNNIQLLTTDEYDVLRWMEMPLPILGAAEVLENRHDGTFIMRGDVNTDLHRCVLLFRQIVRSR